MTKFKFIKYKTNKKIRVIYKNPKSDIFVVFLHGLKSDLTGKKPNYLMKQCKKRKKLQREIRTFLSFSSGLDLH